MVPLPARLGARIAELEAAQNRRDARRELGRVVRLGQEVVGPGLEREHAIDLARLRAHEDHRRSLQQRRLADQAGTGPGRRGPGDSCRARSRRAAPAWPPRAPPARCRPRCIRIRAGRGSTRSASASRGRRRPATPASKLACSTRPSAPAPRVRFRQPDLRHGSVARAWDFRGEPASEPFSQRSPRLPGIVSDPPRGGAKLAKPGAAARAAPREGGHAAPSRPRARAAGRACGPHRFRSALRGLASTASTPSSGAAPPRREAAERATERILAARLRAARRLRRQHPLLGLAAQPREGGAARLGADLGSRARRRRPAAGPRA